jgi:hypothetical protein
MARTNSIPTNDSLLTSPSAEGNRQLIVSQGGAQILCKFMKLSRNKQVLEQACIGVSHLVDIGTFTLLTLIVISLSNVCPDSVRQHIIAEGLVGKLISLLGYNDQQLLVPITNTISVLASHGT